MTQLWLCDKCGVTYEVEVEVKVIDLDDSQRFCKPKMSSLFRQHNEVHKAKGENYAWIVLSNALP